MGFSLDEYQEGMSKMCICKPLVSSINEAKDRLNILTSVRLVLSEIPGSIVVGLKVESATYQLNQ